MKSRFGVLILVALIVSTMSFTHGIIPVKAANPTISGMVRDATGNPIPNVLIVAQETSTELEIASTTSNIDGSYSIPVPVGTYNLIVTPPPVSGFANTTISNVAVSADVTIDIVLIPSGARAPRNSSKIVSETLKNVDFVWFEELPPNNSSASFSFPNLEL